MQNSETKPKEEYQMDLLFFFDLKDPVYKGGLLMVDTFTKYTEAMRIKDKSEGSILSGLKKIEEGFIQVYTEVV